MLPALPTFNDVVLFNRRATGSICVTHVTLQHKLICHLTFAFYKWWTIFITYGNRFLKCCHRFLATACSQSLVITRSIGHSERAETLIRSNEHRSPANDLSVAEAIDDNVIVSWAGTSSIVVRLQAGEVTTGYGTAICVDWMPPVSETRESRLSMLSRLSSGNSYIHVCTCHDYIV